MAHYIYRLFINFLLIHYFIYRLVRWSDPLVFKLMTHLPFIIFFMLIFIDFHKIFYIARKHLTDIVIRKRHVKSPVTISLQKKQPLIHLSFRYEFPIFTYLICVSCCNRQTHFLRGTNMQL